MTKPILCLDFDGVIHSYTSDWKGASVVPDPPVPGAIKFICKAMREFELHIYSSRSHQADGITAMKDWLADCLRREKHHLSPAIHEQFPGLPIDFDAVVEHCIKWPEYKPPAMVTIDDRALTFDGTWPDIEELKNFKPWNKK